jgi:hypothetical protein
MPKVFEKDGYLFFFYMNEHLPIHIHVMKNGKKAKFEVSESEVLLVADGGLKTLEIKKAQELASDRRMEIVAKWHQIFGKEP